MQWYFVLSLGPLFTSPQGNNEESDNWQPKGLSDFPAWSNPEREGKRERRRKGSGGWEREREILHNEILL